MIIPNDYEIPGPEPGEHPVSVRRAAQLTGYSTHVINAPREARHPAQLHAARLPAWPHGLRLSAQGRHGGAGGDRVMDWLAMEAEPLRRMGEWLDAHPRVALAVLVACMLLASVRW